MLLFQVAHNHVTTHTGSLQVLVLVILVGLLNSTQLGWKLEPTVKYN